MPKKKKRHAGAQGHSQNLGINDYDFTVSWSCFFYQTVRVLIHVHVHVHVSCDLLTHVHMIHCCLGEVLNKSNLSRNDISIKGHEEGVNLNLVFIFINYKQDWYIFKL